MTVRAWWDTFCDAPGCLQWTEGGRTPGEARVKALAEGWAVSEKPVDRKFLWFCPGHADHGTRPAA